jgi:hypothetical protein
VEPPRRHPQRFGAETPGTSGQGRPREGLRQGRARGDPELAVDTVDDPLTDDLSTPARDRNLLTTADEFGDELRVWVADAFRAEPPEHGLGGLSIADLAAGLRDREREADGDYRGISRPAYLIGHWLVARAEQPTLFSPCRSSAQPRTESHPSEASLNFALVPVRTKTSVVASIPLSCWSSWSGGRSR